LKASRISKYGISFRLLIIWGFYFCITQKSFATASDTIKVGQPTSTQQQALSFIHSLQNLNSSPYWPNIKPALFIRNLQTTIQAPVRLFPGNGTNFCGYAALTYILLRDDPLSYVKFLIQLYQKGNASFGKINFNPSSAIKKQAGLLRFKGILDIHPAEQMWFLSLADHFKGYLNFFNRRYEAGDEDHFWASVNYAKFNRMVRNLLQYDVNARGTDLLRPHVKDLYQYINEKMKAGPVVLFINNRIVHKKNHVTIKLAVPTHFIVVEKISHVNNLITLVYWDYGGKTQLQLSPAFFKRIIFGISSLTKTEKDAN
jgi:hypothetical protein